MDDPCEAGDRATLQALGSCVVAAFRAGDFEAAERLRADVSRIVQPGPGADDVRAFFDHVDSVSRDDAPEDCAMITTRNAENQAALDRLLNDGV